jgi:hypothetical protein
VDCRTRRDGDGERLPSLRHLAALLLINSGLDIAAVSKLIGHSSIQLTSDTYGHMFDKAGREAAERAAALVNIAGPSKIPNIFSHSKRRGVSHQCQPGSGLPL